MSVESFRVNLQGVVDILSHHLYSSPRVYLRELIQNSRDAIVARGMLGNSDVTGEGNSQGDSERHSEPSQQITIDVSVPGSVVVKDHGIGLTEEEMRSVLASIGASSKREDFSAARRQFLGQFGIGLLSCFLIADRIEVRSRSARTPDAETLTWVGAANGTFTVAPSQTALPGPGTEVTIRARADDAEWVSPQRVRLLAEVFASLLEFPIVVVESAGSDGELVSQVTPPWRDPAIATSWCERHLGFRPLTSWPIAVPAAGVEGLVLIDQNPGRVGNRPGDTVYSHGMFVAADNTQLVPHWAYFARLVVQAGDLALTASREALQESGAVASVREQIGAQLHAGIERFAESDPVGFGRFLEIHDRGLLAMATTDQAMLELVVRHIRWETSEGTMSLEEVRRRFDHIVFTTQETEFTTFAPIVRANRSVLINGSYVYGREILNLVSERWRFKRFDAEKLLDSFQVSSDDQPLVAELARIDGPTIKQLGLELVFRSFEPTNVAVLSVETGTGMSEPVSETDPWAELLEASSPDPMGPKLVLNVASPAVRCLVSITDSAVRAEVVRGLYVLGLLNAGEKLRTSEHSLLQRCLYTLITVAGQQTKRDQQE